MWGIPFTGSDVVGSPTAADQRGDEGPEVLSAEGQEVLGVFGGLFDQQSESVEGFADDAIFASQVGHLLG